MLQATLNDVAGWAATVAHDASEASAVLKQVQIDLVVLDVHLPGISGLELLQILRDDPGWQSPPVLLTTADPHHEQVREAIRRGDAIGLIEKPFNIDDFIAAVGAGLGE